MWEMAHSGENGSVPVKLLSASKTNQEKMFSQSTAFGCFCFFFPKKCDASDARTFLPKHGIYKLKCCWHVQYQGGVGALCLHLSSHTGFPKSPSAVPGWDSCSLPSLSVKYELFVLCFSSHREHSREMDPWSKTLLSQCPHHSCG